MIGLGLGGGRPMGVASSAQASESMFLESLRTTTNTNSRKSILCHLIAMSNILSSQLLRVWTLSVRETNESHSLALHST